MHALIKAMNHQVKIKDKTFEISISANEIDSAVSKVAEKINTELADENPLFLVVLNGAFMFASDLMKKVNIPCEISFVKLASYEGTVTSGIVKELIGLNESLAKRTVVVVEDIVDTGITMQQIIERINIHKPKAIKVCTFFHKPEALQKDIKLDYIGMEIPNKFIVGYGLDYDGQGRNLAEIYTLIQ